MASIKPIIITGKYLRNMYHNADTGPINTEGMKLYITTGRDGDIITNETPLKDMITIKSIKKTGPDLQYSLLETDKPVNLFDINDNDTFQISPTIESLAPNVYESGGRKSRKSRKSRRKSRKSRRKSRKSRR